MKRLVKTVELTFFNDNATGEWGLTHKNTYDDRYGISFNAFWDGQGIFHDIFEHSHEHENKYFKGDYAMNVGGEMTAMGAMWYYFDTLGMHTRLNLNRYSIYTPGQRMKESTLGDVKDSISGNTRYGNTLECNVPIQRPVNDGELEYQIEQYWKDVKKYEPHFYENAEQERKDGETYRKSVTYRKIADLHRYGYRMAERLVPENYDNQTTLIDFLEVWNNFCENNKAEQMKDLFNGLTFKIYKENDRISWKATFHSADRFQTKDVTLTAENINHFDYEDALVYDMFEND